MGIISLGSLINVSTGVNSSIIYLSKKYKAGLLMLLMLFLVTIVLNIVLIPKFGLIGAAASNAIAAILFNGAKYFFLFNRYKMQPFTKTIFYVLLLIVACFMVNYFLPSLSNELVDIAYRSVLISLLYIFVIHKLAIIPETAEYFTKWKLRFFKK